MQGLPCKLYACVLSPGKSIFMTFRYALGVVVALGLAWQFAPANEAIDPATDQQLDPASMVESHCAGCHDGDSPAGGLDLSGLLEHRPWISDYRRWLQVARRVRNHEMPPPEEPALLPDERAAIWQGVLRALREEAQAIPLETPASPLRRLNRFEYRQTVAALLHIQYDAAQDLPAESGGGEGFDNAAETLFMNSLLMEKFLLAAQNAVAYASHTESARKKLFISEPGDELLPDDAARVVLTPFLARAFRRPIDEADLEPWLTAFRESFGQSATFDDSIFRVVTAILVSPQFLFRTDRTDFEGEGDQGISKLPTWSMAPRLSYFLWSSMPDEALFQASQEGKLVEAATRDAEIARMIASPKIRNLAENFMGQWLGTRPLGETHRPDRTQFPWFEDELREAMQEEPILLFQEIIQENRSLLELIDGDHTFANRQLAAHYGLPAQDPPLREHSRRVVLPPDSPRGGIVTMAGPLTVSSYPYRTSPVLRGKWILDVVLGAPPSPPPPNIPSLDTPQNHVDARTVRERLALHRADPTCAGCHRSLDPIGFGLESFDPTGKFRRAEGDQAIDESGTLPDGTTYKGAEELKAWVLSRKEDFIRNLVMRMYGYALGRGLVREDYPAIERIVERLESQEYRAQELVRGIIESPAF